MAFSPDGTRIASGSDDKTVRVWDAATGQPVGQPLTGHTDAVCSVAFSPDGTRIASGSDDKTVRVWDAATGQPVGQPLTGHTDAVCSVAFSPDGTRIASGSGDKTVRLWDAATGQPVGQPLTGHTDAVSSVAFSPDGNRIASGSADKTVRLWDADTGQPVGDPLTGHTDAVSSVAFSPDGTAHRLRQCRQDAAPVARLPRPHVGVVRQAHHQHEPPAVAGLGVARHRLHRSLSGTAHPGRWLKSNDSPKTSRAVPPDRSSASSVATLCEAELRRFVLSAFVECFCATMNTQALGGCTRTEPASTRRPRHRGRGLAR